MTDNPQIPQGRPLVTFALFAYNQEQYIREAVEGAFSQTYEPLEIILSDDCSSDRTFEIMQEMAATYDGPHRVVVRKSEVNVGTAMHVYAAATNSTGAIIVIAAGDDISLPQRCERIVDCWAGSTRPVSCVHSGAILFNDLGASEETIVARARSMTDIEDRIKLLLEDRLPFLSPTCAYSRRLFEDFKPIMGGSIIEDGIMAMRSLCAGAVLCVDEPLVRLRTQEKSSGRGNAISDPDRWNRFVLSRMISYSNKLRDISHTEIDRNTVAILQKMYRRKIGRLSRFVIDPSANRSNSIRLIFLLRYALFYPSSASMINRSADAFLVTGFDTSRLFRFSRKILKKALA